MKRRHIRWHLTPTEQVLACHRVPRPAWAERGGSPLRGATLPGQLRTMHRAGRCMSRQASQRDEKRSAEGKGGAWNAWEPHVAKDARRQPDERATQG